MTKDLPHYKLLCDEQVDFGVVALLRKRRHTVMHVLDFKGLIGKDDTMILDFAKKHGYTVVTLDQDFVNNPDLIAKAGRKKVAIILLSASDGSAKSLVKVFSKYCEHLPRTLRGIYRMSTDRLTKL